MFIFTLTIQPHQKIWFSEIIFFTFKRLSVRVSSIFTFRYKHFFLLKIIFLFWMQKIKKNFEICFWKITKRVNWSNNIVKTKKCTISIEIGIFWSFLKSFFNIRYLTIIIIKLFFYCIFNLWWYLVIWIKKCYLVCPLFKKLLALKSRCTGATI